ncbi:MAG TPA: crosslink repair DNA glycosylase YcaQ family protein, partial [Ilumatobacteraceae bacterium]|nr:crosslink repair DNA glycosylase YcaQ family protein [Ilumatobacteraceae bacterium]
GDTRAHVRAALAAVGAVEVDVEGADAPGYVLADDVAPVEPVAPWAALLPALDPTTMGWKERRWYLGDHAGELFDAAGNGGTTAWWDGRIVGAWHQLDGPEVRIHLLEDIGREGADALAQEAARLTAWLDGARPGGRWPSPVLARLRAGRAVSPAAGAG